MAPSISDPQVPGFNPADPANSDIWPISLSLDIPSEIKDKDGREKLIRKRINYYYVQQGEGLSNAAKKMVSGPKPAWNANMKRGTTVPKDLETFKSPETPILWNPVAYVPINISDFR